MKKDEVLNEFIENILNDNINIEEFVRYIKHYSKFIAYINSEYKYNGTFLNQYTSDFLETRNMLIEKNKIYKRIFYKVIMLGVDCEIYIDDIFYGVCIENNDYMDCFYIKLDKSNILNHKIHVNIKLFLKKDNDIQKYIFCKEYDSYKENDLDKIVSEDVNGYLRKRGYVYG